MPEVVFLSRRNETTILSRRHAECRLIHNTWISFQLLIQVWIRTAVSLCNPSSMFRVLPRGGFHRIPPQLQGSVCSFVSKRNFAASTNMNVYKRNCAQRMHETGHRDRLIPSEHEHDWQEHLSFRLSRRHHEGQSVASHDWGHGVVASVRPAPQRALGPAQSPSNSL